MIMTGGSWGKGSAFFSEYDRTIKISPDAFFSRSEKLPLSVVSSCEIVGANASKKIGETASLGTTGLLVGSALGPLGGILGLALGVLAGGKKTEVVLSIQFRDGRNAVFKATPEDFSSLRTLVQTTPEAAKKKAKARKKLSSSEGGAAKKVASVRLYKITTAIQGRSRETPEDPNNLESFKHITKKKTDSDKNSDEFQLLSSVESNIKQLQIIAWRYLDIRITDIDCKNIICLEKIMLKNGHNLSRQLAEYDRGHSESAKKEAEKIKSSIGFFNRHEKEKEYNQKMKDHENYSNYEKKYRLEAESKLRQIVILEKFIKDNSLSDHSNEVNRIFSNSPVIQSSTYVEKKFTEEYFKIVDPLAKHRASEAPSPELQEISTSIPDIENRLQKLKELFDKNLITTEEFASKKEEILNNI